MSTPYADPDLTLFLQYRDLDAPLGERLAGYATAARKIYPAYGAAVDDLVRRLNDAGNQDGAPGIGEEMPGFMLPDESGRLVGLSELHADGPVAVMFHRGHWCPYCRMNVHALARNNDSIAALGGRVAVVVPERQAYAEALQVGAKATFPVLTDIDNGYAMSLNLAIWLGPDIVRLIGRSGIDLPEYQGNDTWMVPIPATFVVGRDGLIKARFIDPDFRKRMELDDLLAALRRAR
jgi:peroxiredoxin